MLSLRPVIALVAMLSAYSSYAQQVDSGANANADVGHSGKNSLDQILIQSPNAYVSLLQLRLGLPKTGMLTPSTISALNRFCDLNGIGNACRRGPLTIEAAKSLEIAMNLEGNAYNKAPGKRNAGSIPNVDANLNCSAAGIHPPFTRRYPVNFDGSSLSMTRGERGGAYYEVWQGVADNNEIKITGEYIEGTDELKKIEFMLRVDEKGFEGRGLRGPRDCAVSLVFNQ